MPLTPLPPPMFPPETDLILVVLWGALFFTLPLLMRNSSSSGQAAAVLLGLVTLAVVLTRPFGDRLTLDRLVEEEQTPVSVPLVVLPGSGIVGQLVAPDARARVCLKQAFAFPGQITVIVEGKKTVTLTQLPPLLPSGVQLAEFQGLRHHTCEVVQGRPTVWVQARPVEVERPASP